MLQLVFISWFGFCCAFAIFGQKSMRKEKKLRVQKEELLILAKTLDIQERQLRLDNENQKARNTAARSKSRNEMNSKK